MIVRTVGLGAACLALVAESIMIPSTVTLPGLTVESVHRHQDDKPNNDVVEALPITEDILEKFKDLHLGVSKPMPFSDGKGNAGHPTKVEIVDFDDSFFDDFDWENTEFDFDFDLDDIDWDNYDWIEADSMDPSLPSTSEYPTEPLIFFDVEDLDEDSSDCPSGSSLKGIVCRVRSALSSKIEDLKPYFSHHRRPCPKKMAALAKEKTDHMLHRPAVSGGLPKFWPTFHSDDDMAASPKPMSSHKHHSHHHDHHEHMRKIRNKFTKVLHNICFGLRVFITNLLIPVLIGVAAGMTASLLGMCVGTFLAWLWIKFVRGGKRGNASGRVMLDESDECAAVKSEKEGLLETESLEAPPTYVERE